MRCYWMVFTGVLGLTGCVTETTSVTKNNPVGQNQVNNTEAARTRITLALKYLEAGDNTQAKFNLERAANFAPTLPEVHYTLAYYFEQVKEFEQAKQAYQKALALVPNDPNTLNNYGAFLCRIEEYDLASEQFHKAIAIPSYLRVSQSYENLALCSIKAGNFNLAQDYLQSATEHNSQSQSALIGLAAILYAKSDLHQAQGVLAQFSHKGFISARSLMLEHLLHVQMGHLEKAQKLATTLVQTYPQSFQAQLIIKDELNKSEFERLREQYRQAQLAALQPEGERYVAAQPQIKITKKKKRPVRAQSTEQVESLVSATAKIEAQTSSSLRQTTPVKTLPKPAAPNVIQVPALTSSSVANNTLAVMPEQSEAIPEPGTQMSDVNFDMPARHNTQTQPQVRFSTVDKSQVRFKAVDLDNEFTRPRALNQNHHRPRLLNTDILLPRVPTHTVKLGENLFSLSVKYNIKLAKLLNWNDLKESDRLSMGQKIYLNNPRMTHTIQSGDNLYDIATQYRLQMNDLMRWNQITPDVELASGLSLLIVDPNSYAL